MIKPECDHRRSVPTKSFLFMENENEFYQIRKGLGSRLMRYNKYYILLKVYININSIAFYSLKKSYGFKSIFLAWVDLNNRRKYYYYYYYYSFSSFIHCKIFRQWLIFSKISTDNSRYVVYYLIFFGHFIQTKNNFVMCVFCVRSRQDSHLKVNSVHYSGFKRVFDLEKKSVWPRSDIY